MCVTGEEFGVGINCCEEKAAQYRWSGVNVAEVAGNRTGGKFVTSAAILLLCIHTLASDANSWWLRNFLEKNLIESLGALRTSHTRGSLSIFRQPNGLQYEWARSCILMRKCSHLNRAFPSDGSMCGPLVMNSFDRLTSLRIYRTSQYSY
jgi:hypothetical protein